ncbi:MAG: ABC transporter substrate-binding protein [Chloroflexota bacterium]
MNRLVKLLTLGVMLSLLAALTVVPAAAQDECCTGGVIVEGNLTADVATMNPIMASDTASRRIISLTNIGLLGTDPEKGVIAENQSGALAATWDISDDGLVYTFHLRDDMQWNDGTPITAADVLYSWDAIKAGAEGLIDVPASFVYDATGETGILDVTAPDEHTLVVTFATAECTALSYAGSLTPMPRQALPADVTELGDADYNLNPTVTSGPFAFAEFRPGELTSLVGSPAYTDAVDGVVKPAGFIYKNTPDQTVMVEQFLAGELNLIDNPAVSRREDIRNSDSQVYSYPGNAWDYMGFNLADPNNPQNAFDEAGNPIDQGHHPLFGDVRVRQAIARAVDVDSIIQAAVFNEGTRMTSFLIPSSWAYATDLAPIPFDPDAAAAMMEEAGWTDTNGDGIREAHGAAYAEDGTVASFTLYTNEGNNRREAIGTLIQDQLAQIGIQVDFQTIDFNTLLDIQDSQTYDAIILGWRNSYPDDPDVAQLFTPVSDILSSGSDNTSYNNPEFTELNTQAKNVPGCAIEDRAPFYVQMQSIFQQDLPYLPLFVQNGMYTAGANVAGFDPRPSNLIWNMDAWDVATP